MLPKLMALGRARGAAAPARRGGGRLVGHRRGRAAQLLRPAHEREDLPG